MSSKFVRRELAPFLMTPPSDPKFDDGETSPVWGWIVVGLSVLLFIIGPFLVFGPSLEGWMKAVNAYADSSAATLVWSASLLCLDVLLPVPSSAVAAIACHALGPGLGFFVVWGGLSAGSALGLLLGNRVGRPGLHRVVGPRQIDAAASLIQTLPAHAIFAATRGVPVLAEALVLVGGASAKTWPGGVFTACVAGNAAVAAGYAIGTVWTAQYGAPGVLASSVAVPAVFGAALAVVLRLATAENGHHRKPRPE